MYSRLGRLITTFRPAQSEWNGFNSDGGKEPSSDYWFLVEFNNNGVLNKFQGNFSLLRK